ncbi:hypothetical protein [Edwardsiella tarda]|uniref:hypothetical protein n=1 Tax=Edwardsiella tarda TaxID=636 RepID=UPI0005511A12|nr:hypothetical protein [Edwardsiella tarda]
MPIIIEKVAVTVTFPDGERVSGFTSLPPNPANPLFVLYEEGGVNGSIINLTKVRDVKYQVIERKAK